MRYAMVAAMAAGLAGCAEHDRQLQMSKMDALLAPYIGKSIAEYVLNKGPPTNTIDLGHEKRGFQWVFTTQSAAAIVPIGGVLVAVPSRQLTCTVIFTASTIKQSPALSDWVIETWRWSGNC